MNSAVDVFTEAAQSGRLVIQNCLGCGRGHLPPRMRCESCGATDFEWTEASGLATLVSYVVQHRSPPEHEDRIPYIYALVRLAEGPAIVTNVVGCDHDELTVGLGLRAVFERTDDDGAVWPEFVPSPERGA